MFTINDYKVGGNGNDCTVFGKSDDVLPKDRIINDVKMKNNYLLYEVDTAMVYYYDEEEEDFVSQGTARGLVES